MNLGDNGDCLPPAGLPMHCPRPLVCSLLVVFHLACSASDDPMQDADAGDLGIDAGDTSTDIAPDVAGASCGDGVVDAPYEQCEPSLGFTCAEIGFRYGVATCTDACRANTTACSAVPICGDGVVDAAPNGDETCDDGGLEDGDGCDTECQLEVCGDTVISTDEECDGDRTIACPDGSLGVQRCSDTCQLDVTSCLQDGVCGDGTIDAGEACDDGNELPGDGCDTDCRLEACGDGVRQGQEACDGNDLGELSCMALGFDLGTLYCSDACRPDTERCVITICGDGLLQGEEACDDGNRTSGDGCDRSCVVETCGDGRAAPGIGEQCDGVDVQGLTCADFGFALSALTCQSDCRVDLSECLPLPRCGDGLLDADLGETCDDGNVASDDGCSAGCVEESCGDGVVQGDEVCEPGVAPSETCADRGDFISGRTTCDDDCTIDDSACVAPGCGNGILEDNEPCDGVLTDAACTDEGFDFGRFDCTDTCELDDSSCRYAAICGDGIQFGTEECDDGNRTDGDGCSFDCISEFCGDGIVQPSLAEICDGSPSITLGCDGEAAALGVVSCEETCAFGPRNCFAGECGNGIVEVGEACDDGDRSGGDGCDSFCRSETCGDGTLQDYEACDSDLSAASCEDIGVFGGSISCTTCTADYSSCGLTPTCGNGQREAGEACDDGDVNGDAPDACRTDCTLPRCGDGVVDDGETCDDGAAPDGCPDSCRSDAFVIPDDGDLSDALDSPFELILVRGSVAFEQVPILENVTIRGLGDDATLAAAIPGQTVINQTTGELTLENLSIVSESGAYGVVSIGDVTVRNVAFAPINDGHCLTHSGGPLAVFDSEFTNCVLDGVGGVDAFGGAISSTSIDVTIERSSFLDCGVINADNVTGGAIGLRPSIADYTINMTDVSITRPFLTTTLTADAQALGGGIDIQSTFAGSGNVMIDGLVVTDAELNSASDGSAATIGGGLAVRASGVGQIVFVLLSDAVFVGATLSAPNNVSSISGGGAVAVHATSGATITLQQFGFEFAENTVDSGAGQAKGGGLYAEADGPDSVVNVTLYRGLLADNEAISTTEAYGGAMELRAVNGGVTNGAMRNVTAVANSATHGGAYYLYADVDVASSVVFRVAHLTVVDNDATNQGGGLVTQGNVELEVRATMVVGNTAPLGPQCRYGAGVTITTSTNNIGPRATCRFVDATDADYDLSDILRPLANNGSASRTLLPVSPSLAANAYRAPCFNENGGDLFLDQRGYARPTDPDDLVDGDCDIGAAEVSADE